MTFSDAVFHGALRVNNGILTLIHHRDGDRERKMEREAEREME